MAALTAWQVLVDTAHVRPGQRVLVTAAAGGVGHFAVQIAHYLGALVVATASPANHVWLKELGADEVIDYHDSDPYSLIKDIDVVVDLMGEAEQRGLVATVRAGGLFVSVPRGVSADLADVAQDRDVAVSAFLVEPDGVALARIGAVIEEGEIRVEVAWTFPVADVAAAHRLAEANHTRGKTVLLTASEG